MASFRQNPTRLAVSRLKTSVWFLLVFGTSFLVGCEYSSGPLDAVSGDASPLPSRINHAIASPSQSDFGLIRADSSISKSHVLSNNSTETLTIKNIATGCGCVSVSCDKMIIPPKDSTLLEVTLRSPKDSTDLNQLITVTFAEASARLMIPVTAIVRRELTIVPRSLALSLGENTEHTVHIYVYNYGQADWATLAVTELPSWASVAIEPMKDNAIAAQENSRGPRQTWSLRLDIRTESLMTGVHLGDFNVRPAGTSEIMELVPLRLTVLPRLRTFPNHIVFDKDKRGTSKTITVVLSPPFPSNDQLQASSTIPDLSVSWSTTSEAVRELSVTLLNTPSQGYAKGSIRIENPTSSAKVIIPVTISNLSNAEEGVK